MTERAAHHLVDAVLLWVPVRQWVLTVLYRLRHQMAWNHGLSRAVLRVYTRALLDVYARGARECGIAGGQTGAVTALQRVSAPLKSSGPRVRESTRNAWGLYWMQDPVAVTNVLSNHAMLSQSEFRSTRS
jgi:hypothetical protein